MLILLHSEVCVPGKRKKKKFPLGKCSHNAIPQLYSVVCIILVLHVSWLLSSHHVLLAAGVEGY